MARRIFCVILLTFLIPVFGRDDPNYGLSKEQVMKFYRVRVLKNMLEGGGDTLTRHGWDDDGGGTKGGFTQDTFNNYLDKYKLPRRDISTITPQEQVGIMFHEYWMPTGAQMPAGIDFMAFQFGFVTHPITSNKLLQGILMSHGLYAGRIDGFMGPLMFDGLQGLNKYNAKCILDEMAIAHDRHFEKVDKKRIEKGKESVLPGWKNRTKRALEMSLNDLEIT